MAPAPIDLLHEDTPRVVGAYLIDTDGGPAIVDCGPASCIERLEGGLAEHGVALADVRHLLLTHIHLDHAGAAGSLVRRHPALLVHVSEIGAPHVVDPSRLERSARRLYADDFDRLWGELLPVPAENVRIVGSRTLGLETFPTPGHASHHVSYLDADGTLFTGDAVGVRIQPGRYVFPAAPPPDIDLDLWEQTFRDIEARSPERFALTHFGVADDPADHLARTRDELVRLAERVRSGLDQAEFVAAVRRDIEAADERDVPYYERAGPIDQTFLGLERYWTKRAEAEAAAAAG